MIDPSFGDIEFHGDAWDSLVPVDFASTRTSALAVHVRAEESGPTSVQRTTFEELKVRYPGLSSAIIATLLNLHPDLDSAEDAIANLKPTVGCYIEPEGGSNLANFELVYEFNLDGENARGFFIRIVDWQIAEAVIAE